MLDIKDLLELGPVKNYMYLCKSRFKTGVVQHCRQDVKISQLHHNLVARL